MKKITLAFDQIRAKVINAILLHPAPKNRLLKGAES